MGIVMRRMMVESKKLSVLICTRNGARTILEAVSHSVASLEAWDSRAGELIVVDNGSTDDTRLLAESACAGSEVDFVPLVASRPGKIHAFDVGIRAARADFVCIIDDDNNVDVGFFGRLYEFLAAYPDVGVVGGLNALDPRVKAPEWFDWAKHFMACTRPHIEENVVTDAAGREVGEFGWIPGAGMGFRRKPLIDALDAGYGFFNDTQRGRGMRVTGEDSEMCLLFRSMGYRFGFDPGMRLWHHIAPDRLTPDAYWLLCRTIGAGSPGTDPFMFTSKRPPGRLPLAWSWQWQWLSKMRRLAALSLPGAMSDYGAEERRFRLRTAINQCRGAIGRILAERSKYDEHIRNVASGEWTRYRVR